jgi:hypothetical protein
MNKKNQDKGSRRKISSPSISSNFLVPPPGLCISPRSPCISHRSAVSPTDLSKITSSSTFLYLPVFSSYTCIFPGSLCILHGSLCILHRGFSFIFSGSIKIFHRWERKTSPFNFYRGQIKNILRLVERLDT